MEAINPFAILGIDEAASREEIDAARRRLVVAHHPDRHADGSPEKQQAAADRVAEINYAYGLLTDPAKAAAHKRMIERVRAAGHHVAPPRQATSAGGAERPTPSAFDYRQAATAEFTVGGGKAATPWTARRSRRRWFGRAS